MKPPSGFLATPPEKRRNTKFNVTFSVHPDELAEAARQLGMLAPDGKRKEIVYRLRAELRIKRTSDGENLNVQTSWTIAAVESSR